MIEQSKGKLVGARVRLCNSMLCNVVLAVAKLQSRKSDVPPDIIVGVGREKE